MADAARLARRPGLRLVCTTLVVGAALAAPPLVGGACVPPPAGLVAWWRGELNLVDSAGTTPLLRDPATANVWGTPRVGAAGFDLRSCGTCCSLTASANPMDYSTASFSLDAWVRFGAGPSSLAHTILDTTDTSTFPNMVGFWLWMSHSATSTALHLYLFNGSGTGEAFSAHGVPLADGQWHLVTMTVARNGDLVTVVLHVDGNAVLASTRSYPGDLDDGEPLHVGKRNVPTVCSNVFPGEIDEIEWFDRVLSLAEVQSIFQAGPDGKCPPALLFDHLKCYKVRDPLKLAAAVDLESRLGIEPGCQVRRAIEYCVPVAKRVVSSSAPTDDVPGQHLLDDRLCYRIRCPQSPLRDLAAHDQFGNRLVQLRTPTKLCTPVPPFVPTTTPTSTTVAPTTTSTTTTTTTTTSTSSSSTTQPPGPTTTSTSTTTTLPPPWPGCGDASVTAPTCDGICPAGFTCTEPVAGGGCTCEPATGQPCGSLAGPPQCWGECPPDPTYGMDQICGRVFFCSVSGEKCKPPAVLCPLPDETCDPACRCLPPPEVE